jgi:ribose transport system substrate-binding protein
VDVRRGLEVAAKKSGNIDLVLADNDLNAGTAQHVADRMLDKNVDLFIEYQIDEKHGNLIMNKFQQAGIPVIAVDIPMVGATFFGADNYQTGRSAGVAMGEWICRHWGGKVGRLVVLEEARAGSLPAARMQGQLDGVQAKIGQLPASSIVHVPSGATIETGETQMLKVFKKLEGIQNIAILSFNDDVAIGALHAARKLGLESNIAIVGQGADRLARNEIRQPNSRFIGSTTFMPEKYGEKLVKIALKILRGKVVPPATYVEHVFVNAGNIDFFYPE